MKAEDYDAFIDDPRTGPFGSTCPAPSASWRGFGMLPPLGMTLFGYYNLRTCGLRGAARVSRP